MKKVNKRLREFVKSVDRTKTFTLADAVDQVTKFPKTKFDETVELHFHLGIDVKASEQGVRGTVALPHGSGKKVRVAVFCKGPQAQKATDAGAEYVGAEELIDKVNKGFMDFDCVVATPDMMKDLSKLGKVLGPRGLMPSPKSGTVTVDVEKAVREVKAGKIEFKSDKQAGVHVGIGKRSFTKDQLVKNAQQVIDAVSASKTAAVKGNLIKSVFLSTTMGPGLRLAL